MADFPMISTVQDAVLMLMATQAPALWLIGINLFKSFAVIKLVWWGIDASFHGADIGSFVSLILLLAIGDAMIVFYNSAIPGIGQSFASLVPSMSQYIAALFDARAYEQTSYAIDLLGSRFAAPTAWNFLLNFMFGALWLVLYGLKGAALVASIGPLVATSLLVLFGPLPVAFFVVDQLSWIFWGWLRAILTCAFYQPFALAYVLLLAQVLERMVSSWPATIAPSEFMLYFGEIAVVAFAFVAGLAMLPRVVGMVFGGGSSPMIAMGSALRSAGAALAVFG